MNRRESNVTVGGHRLEVTWYGPSPDDGPTLVFLHEGLGCAAMWRDFPARVSAATGCGALVYSRLGYGRSDPCPLPRPLDFMHEEGLRVFPELLEVTGIRDYILIGHSDGGSIALIHAGGTPAKRLRGVIVEAPHVFCEEVTVRSIEATNQSYRIGDLRSRLERYHGSNTDCAFWGWSDSWRHPDFIHWNIEPYLQAIRTPVLVIQGELDEYGTLAQVEAITRQVGSEVQSIVFTDCGHAPHREQETKTLQAMVDFIARILT